MRLNRPQSLHSNTNCPPLPENAGTYLSKPFEHPYTNQNSGSNPSILCKSFAKAPSFFLKHGVNGGKQGLFCPQRPHFLSPPRGEVRAAWPLIESAAEWETSSLRMKDEKKQCDSEEIGAAAFSHHVLPLAAAAFFAFSPSSADEVANTATQKRPRRESTPLMGGFLAAGESRKRSFCAYKPREAARASAQCSPSMAAETMPPA